MGEDESESLVMVYAKMTLSVTGILGNTLIVLATIVSKNLHSRCQFLIAFLAATDAVLCVHLMQLRIWYLKKWFMMPNRDCFLASALGLFAFNIQAAMGLVLGVDRLLAVSKPIKYNSLPKSLHAGMILAVLCFATIVTGKGWLDVTDDPVPVCIPPTAYTSAARTLWIDSSFVIALIVLVVYSLANIKCQRMNSNTVGAEQLKRTRRLLNSLTLVVAVYFSTWFLTTCALLATVVFPLSKWQTRFINEQLAWLVVINSASNPFIYLWRSREYRKVILSLLSFGLSEHVHKKNTLVVTVATTEMSRRK